MRKYADIVFSTAEHFRRGGPDALFPACVHDRLPCGSGRMQKISFHTKWILTCRKILPFPKFWLVLHRHEQMVAHIGTKSQSALRSTVRIVEKLQTCTKDFVWKYETLWGCEFYKFSVHLTLLCGKLCLDEKSSAELNSGDMRCSHISGGKILKLKTSKLEWNLRFCTHPNHNWWRVSLGTTMSWLIRSQIVQCFTEAKVAGFVLCMLTGFHCSVKDSLGWCKLGFRVRGCSQKFTSSCF